MNIDMSLIPEVRPFLPIIYVAWTDADLTNAELISILALIAKKPLFSAEGNQILQDLLQIKKPPSAEILLHIAEVIKRDGANQNQELISLADLGLQLTSGSEKWLTEDYRRHLFEVEALLGVKGKECARQLLPLREVDQKSSRVQSSFDTAKMSRFLDGDHWKARQRVRNMFSEDLFAHRYGLSTAERRELILRRCQQLSARGIGRLMYPEYCGGTGDIGQFLAVFEDIGFHDLNLVTKMGVQFGLFGGSILFLGTARHHRKWLPAVADLALPGCFAMTELGHGSNVRALETTAFYHHHNRTLVINSPTETSRKEYIGNAALHGTMATVFAQLYVDGVCHGVHAILVPIRDENHNPCSGVRIEDCGEKMGLNGVDNGRLYFDQVSVSVDNLLDRFGEITEEGQYHSEIASPNKRFFTMLSNLVGGRVSIACAAQSAAKSGLTIAIRYADRRRQFGPSGEHEITILDYLSHQRRLFPLLAKSYALDFATKHLASRYLKRTEDDLREVEVLAAGLKAYSSWHTTQTLQVCRECCGAQGYMSKNRFDDLKADSDIFTTFEGDNTVLMQLVAKGVLTDFKQNFNLNFFSILTYLAGLAGARIAEQNPLLTRNCSPEHLRDTEFHLSAFRTREDHLTISAARRMHNKVSTMDSFAAFIACQDHLLSLAHAHIERVVLEQLVAGIDACEDESLCYRLHSLQSLYVLSVIEADRGWFLEEEIISANKSRAIRKEVNKLCRELREDAVALVDSFGIPDECLAKPGETGFV